MYKIISLKKYNVNNKARDIHDIIKMWVNWEEKSWYETPKPVLLKVAPVKVKKDSPWWIMFFKTLRP